MTRGQPTVTAVHATSGHSEAEILTLAASTETDSEHPLARAIVAAAEQGSLRLDPASDITSSPAVGVTATVDGRQVAVGGPNLVREQATSELPIADEWRADGAIILHVLVDGWVVGALKLADEIRPESRAAVSALQARRVQVVMVTGDADAVAASVAADAQGRAGGGGLRCPGAHDAGGRTACVRYALA